MYKKLIYFVSVSALTFSLLGSQGQAVFEDEAYAIVQKTLARSKPSDKVEKEEKKEDSYWTMASSVLTPLANVTGGGLRYFGDLLRGEEESVVASLLTEEALSRVKGASTSTDRAIEKVETSEGTMAATAKLTGNGLRWLGSCLQDETPTLARDLRRFWVEEKRMADQPQDVLPSTVCALMMSMSSLGGVDEVAHEYRSFLKAWNLSSQTVPSKEEAENLDYFLKGLLRSLVRTEKRIETFEDIGSYLVAFKFDITKLPAIKKITEETLFPKQEEREKMASGELKNAVETTRNKEFMKYVEGELQTERLKLKVKQETKLLFPSSSSSSSRLAIEEKKPTDEAEKGTNENNAPPAEEID